MHNITMDVKHRVAKALLGDVNTLQFSFSQIADYIQLNILFSIGLFYMGYVKRTCTKCIDLEHVSQGSFM